MPVILQTTGLLILSNVFMTFAWYGHLKNLSNKAWYVAAIISWGIALFEYLPYTQVRAQWTRFSFVESTT
jgi:uncharacterized protein (DUF486 family)